MMTSISFTVLSSASSEAEIFNCLVPVRRHDTGEEGLLLCSHYCRWPVELVPQATWLEGCYTPKRMEDDPRLLMGYHPHHLVSWSYDLETKVVELKLYGSGGEGGGYDEDYGEDFIQFPLPYEALSTDTYLYRWIDRVFSPSLVEGDEPQSAQNVFTLAVRLLEQKRIDHAIVLGLGCWLQSKVNSNVHCYVGEWFSEMLDLPVQEETDEEDEYSIYDEDLVPFSLEYHEGYIYSPYLNLIPLVNGEVNSWVEGYYAMPQALPYKYEEGALVVDKYCPEDGFIPASDLIYHLQDGLTIVLENQEGWHTSVPIDKGKTFCIGESLYKCISLTEDCNGLLWTGFIKQ